MQQDLSKALLKDCFVICTATVLSNNQIQLIGGCSQPVEIEIRTCRMKTTTLFSHFNGSEIFCITF